MHNCLGELVKLTLGCWATACSRSGEQVHRDPFSQYPWAWAKDLAPSSNMMGASEQFFLGRMSNIPSSETPLNGGRREWQSLAQADTRFE